MTLYRAVVLNNQDPEGLSRLKVLIPALAPESESPWAWPNTPTWDWPLPSIGDPVWVDFEAGDKGYPVWMGTWARQNDVAGVVVPGTTSGPRPASSVGTGGGHTIADEGVNLPQRTTLDFQGAGVTAVDSSGRTVIVIPGGGGGGTGENEVFIGPSDPIATYPTIELWIDTDATAGGGVTNYTHDQGTPSATWVVVHNLGFNPSVRAEDSAGNDIEGDVVYNSVNQLTITFSAAIAGKSYHS